MRIREGLGKGENGLVRICACLLLLVMFWLLLSSARHKSATFDEEAYVGKGTAIWLTGDYRLLTAHPALAPMLGTALLKTQPDLVFPYEHPGWTHKASARQVGAQVLFYLNDTQRVLWLARLPIMGLALLLAAAVYRWSRELYGSWAALGSLALVAFDPNLLAHGRLLTLDMATASFYFLMVYAFFRFWERPGWIRLFLSGVTVGTAFATRFAAASTLPVLAWLALRRLWAPGPPLPRPRRSARWFVALTSRSARRRWAAGLLSLLAIGGIGAVVVWLVHGANWGRVDAWNVSLPAPAYWNDLADLMTYVDRPQDAFLLGRHYQGGHWAYFPVALAVKTPLATLLLVSIALIGLCRQRDVQRGEVALLLAAGVHFGSSLISPFNIGYRHLLPMLPFLCVLAGRPLRAAVNGAGWQRLALGGVIAWLIVSTGAIYPHFLAYFNEVVGGPANGHKVLVDSNVDWGQDLPALEAYVTSHNVDRLYLSWFGASRPTQYAIPFRAIPSKPDDLTDVQARVYHPDYPPPGLYAISVTNLQGLLFDDKDLFHFFLERSPLAQPGYSIHVYRVPRLLDPDAPAAAVLLSGVQVDQLPGEVFERWFQTNDLHLRWFNAQDSLVLPGEMAWVVRRAGDAEQAVDASLLAFLGANVESVGVTPARSGDKSLEIFRLISPTGLSSSLSALSAASPLLASAEYEFAPGDAPDLRRSLAPPVVLGNQLELLGYRLTPPGPSLIPGGQLDLSTVWRARVKSPPPLKLFVQLLDDQSNVWARYDGLSVPAIGWWAGDVFVQRVRLTLPDDFPTGVGRYWLQMGAYEARTVERLPVMTLEGEVVGNRVLLPPFQVGDALEP